MKKLLAFILLLSHMNTSMFLPQEPEDDQYDANGSRIDDVNSVTEFIAVYLGYDHSADDEDDDSGQHFHLVKAFDYTFEQHYSLVEKAPVADNRNNQFPEYITAPLQVVIKDIITPPPEA